MGQTHAPDYADIFMSVIDQKILEVAALHGEGVFPIRLMKRFLDDLFFIYTGSLENLHGFLKDINNIHENIKLLSQYTSMTSILLDFLTLGTVRERFDTLLIDRPPQNQ